MDIYRVSTLNNQTGEVSTVELYGADAAMEWMLKVSRENGEYSKVEKV